MTSQLDLLITFSLELKSRWKQIRERSEIFAHTLYTFPFDSCLLSAKLLFQPRRVGDLEERSSLVAELMPKTRSPSNFIL